MGRLIEACQELLNAFMKQISLDVVKYEYTLEINGKLRPVICPDKTRAHPESKIPYHAKIIDPLYAIYQAYALDIETHKKESQSDKLALWGFQQ